MISVGCWFTFRFSSNPLPTRHELPHLFATALNAEALTPPPLPEGMIAATTPFHQIAAVFVQFFGLRHGQEYSLRTYRLFPMTLVVLLLCLIPALGLKRRGGLFGTEDGPFWVALFTFVAPAFFDFGREFLPFTFQLLLFLLLLIAARAYVQWPGYASAASLGALIGLTLLADGAALWFLIILIPAICVAVGWRRIRLYWHTGHVLTLLAFIPLLVGIGILLDFNAPLLYPAFVPYWETLKQHAIRRLLWFGLGGFGVLAWIMVTIRVFCRPDKRWEKVIAILFPICGVATFAFPEGSIFTTSWVLQSALLISFLLSDLRWKSVRLLLGSATILVLGFSMVQLTTSRHAQHTAIANQYATVQTLTELLRNVEPTRPRVTIFSNAPFAVTTLSWMLRETELLPISEMHQADLRFIDGGVINDTLPTPPKRSLATLVLPPNHLFYCLPKQPQMLP